MRIERNPAGTTSDGEAVEVVLLVIAPFAGIFNFWPGCSFVPSLSPGLSSINSVQRNPLPRLREAILQRLSPSLMMIVVKPADTGLSTTVTGPLARTGVGSDGEEIRPPERITAVARDTPASLTGLMAGVICTSGSGDALERGSTADTSPDDLTTVPVVDPAVTGVRFWTGRLVLCGFLMAGFAARVRDGPTAGAEPELLPVTCCSALGPRWTSLSSKLAMTTTT